MQTYRAACKARVVQRLMGPRAVSANRLAATVGVSHETLSRWLRQARDATCPRITRPDRSRCGAGTLPISRVPCGACSGICT